MNSAADSPPTLTPAQAKKLETWRRLVMACLWAAGLTLVTECVLLIWPGVSRTARLVVAGLFVELAIATAVLGALGRCPACNSSLEGAPGELLPERCRQCGVTLQTRRTR